MCDNIDKLCEGVEGLKVKSRFADILHQSVDNCDYVKNCKGNKKKDTCSLSSLVNKSLSQSECIKLGIGIEQLLRLAILTALTHLKDIKKKNSKGTKEKDHLFIDETRKIVYYAEIKGNLNLDTEKHKETIKKCVAIKQELADMFPGYEIRMFLVGARHLFASDIPKTIKNKYKEIDSNLVGINDYLISLGYKDELVTEDEYRFTMNHMADTMFNEE